MKKIKSFLRRISAVLVTWYYNRLFRKAVEAADKEHELHHETFYVIDNFVKGQTLSVINRRTFRWIKDKAAKLHKDPIYSSPEYGTPMLRQQAWYHTPDRGGNNGLTEREKEIRRLAFIRSGLKKARLIEK